MSLLLSVPNEIIQNILEEVDPDDLASLKLSCSALNHQIINNRLLFKKLYLRSFDGPLLLPGAMEPDWEADLYNLITLKAIFESYREEVKEPKFVKAYQVILKLLQTANKESSASRNVAFLDQHLKIRKNKDAFLCRSSLFENRGTENELPAKPEHERQLSAHLHCLYGVPVDPVGRRQVPSHPFARSRIYDLRNYTDKTRWGPFKKDGSMEIDWEMVEAIMVDLGYNMQKLVERSNTCMFKGIFDSPFWGVTADSDIKYPPKGVTLPLNSEPSIPLAAMDPYNITGTWMRIVCFLDYNDLFTFNFMLDEATLSEDEARPPLIQEEATRMIILFLQVTKIEPLTDSQKLPVVHFDGISQSLDSHSDPNANSRIKGTVSLNSEGIPHWTTVSIFYGGEERWRSEGIQVGGVNSRRGVFGTWFDKDYDMHGPAGPTAFWKLSNLMPERKPLVAHLFE